MDGQRNLVQKIIIADEDVINYGLTWQTVFNTVFGFQFSVKKICDINKLMRQLVSFESKRGIKGAAWPPGSRQSRE